MLSDFVKYVRQYWHDRPDKSTPINAERMNHIENGIEANANAIDEIAKAVVSNIVNDPNKIASMAAVYALQEKLGTGNLPSDTSDVISAINALNSNLGVLGTPYTVGENFVAKEDGFLNLAINPSSVADSFIQLQIGSRYIAGSSNAAGHLYNVFSCVKKNDKVTVVSGQNASNQTWIFIPLSSK